MKRLEVRQKYSAGVSSGYETLSLILDILLHNQAFVRQNSRGASSLASEAQTYFRSSLLYFSEAEKRRPEIRLRFAGYLIFGDTIVFSLLIRDRRAHV